MISIFYFLSGPVASIFDGFQNIPLGEATDEMALHSPNIEWAINLVFALGAAIPITWFIFWVFSQDPFQGIRRRRY